LNLIEAPEDRSLELKRQQLDELSGASLRALAGEPSLHYRRTQLYRSDRRLSTPAPHLQLSGQALEQAQLGTRRALVDASALRITRSDPVLHQSLAPKPAIERLLFDWLEQLRAESQAPQWMPGQKHNLHQRFLHWSSEFQHSGQLETAIGLLLFAIAQVCWSRLTGHPVEDEAADNIEGTRARLAPVLGPDFAALRGLSNNQAGFSTPALKISQWVAAQIRAEIASQAEAREQLEGAGAAKVRASFAILLDLDQDDDEKGLKAALSGNSKVFEDSFQQYRVFTKAFDRELLAGELLRAQQLKEYRNKLDALVQAQGTNLQRLAKQLQAVLAKPQRDGWDFGQDEGVIDGRRLSQLLSSPSERRLFKTERFPPKSDSILSILIDCSGSMKAHVETVAVLADLFARALDRVGIANEVLGFTTGSWNGGRARQAWLQAGQGQHPGRLNEINHLIFKAAHQRWRHARGPLGALFKPEIFREGIDGEAVEWACQRLRNHSAERRLLLVISDGCPMDTATNQANDTYYLDNHLKQVIETEERKGQVEILGIGVGLDLSLYYKRCIGIDSSRKVDSAMLDEIVQMIAGRHRV
jgi:cobaltochelatase CobT